MKKLIQSMLVSLCFILPVAVPVYVGAVDVLDPVCEGSHSGDEPAICKEAKSQGDPILGSEGILARVISILSLIVGIACVIVIIISGLRFIVSAGDSNAISSARRSLLYAVVGLLIVLISRLIVRFVLSRI